MVPPPSSTSPTESTSSGISSQKSNMGLDELIESLSFFVETSNSPTNSGGRTSLEHPRQVTNLNGKAASTATTSLRSKRELIASMNGTIRRGPGDLDLMHNNNNHSDRNGGVSWSNQVKKGINWHSIQPPSAVRNRPDVAVIGSRIGRTHYSTLNTSNHSNPCFYCHFAWNSQS